MEQEGARALRALTLVWLVAGCVTTRPASGPGTTGLASWYGAALAGKKTASGEPFDPNALTAAHRTFAFGKCVRVEVVETGASVEVRINDRGPFVEGRIIDVSEAAARALGFVEQGVARVRLSDC